ncbi:MAG: FIST C-terminal domain-containing protein [Candidatus Portnoybacteria bacterium]|nr:FIST C-terminal domain-containing protein [Candidatus Portnoybacteria bacterium]
MDTQPKGQNLPDISNRIKIVGLIVVLLIIAVGIMYFVTGQRNKTSTITPGQKPFEQSGQAAGQAGYGSSEKTNIKEAVAEASASVITGLKGQSPEWILLFVTAGYDVEEVVKEVRNTFPQAKLHGGTSSVHVITKDSMLKGENMNSLALMAVNSPRIDFGVAGAEVSESLTAKEAGKKAILEAIANAGKEGQIPPIVYITASYGNEEDILKGMEEVVGNNTPILGGSAADNDFSGKWKEINNSEVYGNGLVVTVFFTDLKVGWNYDAGYFVTEHEGTVTKSKGRIIYEIDNKPAAEVYNEWTGGLIKNELAGEGSLACNVVKTTTYNPLARVIPGANKEMHDLAISVKDVILPEKALSTFANVYEGDKITMMHGNWELLLNRGQTTALKAMNSEGIKEGDGLFGIYTYCACTMLGVPEDELKKMPLIINSVTGNLPYIGNFTFGEQGLLKGWGNEHGNLIGSMIIFSQ